MRFFETQPLKQCQFLPDELAIIRSVVLNCKERLGNWVSYEAEGILGGREAIVLNIKVSLPPRSPYDLLKSEKIAICLSKRNNLKFDVCALRKDFPDLPHRNATLKGAPKELCLFDVPAIDRVYNETLINFLFRVKKWLDRAAVGELHLDEQGMEPFISDNIGYLVLDSETEKRMGEGSTGYELIATKFVEHNEYHKKLYIEISSFEFGKGGSKIPFALLPINSNPSSDQCISFLPVNYLELAELLENKLYINLDGEILNFISITYKRGVLKKYEDKDLLGEHFLIAICIPRLNSVRKEVGNEIVAFDLFESVKNIGKALGCIREQPGIKTKKRIYRFTNGINRREDELKEIVPVPFSVVRPFSQRLAKDMAGIDEDISDITISVVGIGALGSQLVLNMARQGFSNWKLIDDDILLPHNFARHGLSAHFRGQMKALALKQELDLILEKPEVTPYCTRFTGVKDNKDRKMFDSSIIIDSTASYSVFLPLAYMEDIGQRIFSTYYTGGGLTSVLLAEDKARTIRLDDIDLQIKIKGLDDPVIKTIYRTRETNQLVYSTSCSSQTTVMAQDLVAIHAGIITRQIKELIFTDSTKVYINLMSEDAYGVNVKDFIPCNVIITEIEAWKFRISQSTLDEMNDYRNQKLPNETGGVLIGWINSYEKIIYVGKALPAPPDSVERPYYTIRGKEGLYNKILEIGQTSNNDLYYVGEWHSHPHNSSVTQSGDDLKSMARLSRIMLEETLPGVMLILGDNNDLGCYVESGWEK